MNSFFKESELLVIAKHFDTSAIKIDFLRKSHNYIFKVTCSNAPFILRVSSEKHRSIQQIESEIDFQCYLYKNGAPVVTPIFTSEGKCVIIYKTEGQNYFVSALSWAKGDNWDNRSDYTTQKQINIGKALGSIHRLSKKYTPKGIVKRRFWYESQHLIQARKIFLNYNSDLYRIFIEYMEEMKTLSKEDNVFGLTHGDYLLSNYMIDDKDNVTVFDFDECEYSWYATDISICLHCYLIGASPEQLSTRADVAETMLYNILLGYKSESSITENMVWGLEPLFKMRDFIYLSTILTKEKLYEWDESFIKTCLDRLLNNKPFLKFDLTKAACLL